MQIGQVMAATLLNNINLDEYLLTSAKLELIALAEECPKQENEDMTKLVSNDSFEKLVNTAKAHENINNINPKRAGISKLMVGSRNITFALIFELEGILSELEVRTTTKYASRSVAHLFSLPSSACKAHLDDVAIVLCSVNQFYFTQKKFLGWN